MDDWRISQLMRWYKLLLGDDVFGDDPTVNELQEFAAEKLGMVY